MSHKRPMYVAIASTLDAYCRCVEQGNAEWRDKHAFTIGSYERNFLPHGSGFDAGSTLDLEASTPERLVFNTSFHHMNETGFYDGWTEHTVVVTPSLCFDFEVRVTGRDRNDIKDYIAEVFADALRTEVE
jgi:hypothetical protein